MSTNQPKITYLKDYKVPAFLVETVELTFDIQDQATRVTSCLDLVRNPGASEAADCFLYGNELKLLDIKCNNRTLKEGEYRVDPDGITILNVPDHFILEIITEIYPEKNTALSGLYQSDNMLCTQCEAEGFRRITYYPDRPDVMAKFTTTIIADKKKYPVLLSNGNLIESDSVDSTRHRATWEDPFKKPSYLFALVAGDLMSIEDHFLTKSNRLVTLKIYVEPENIDKCAHAMQALKKSMHFDEVNYGREYDLDIYMIVAVNAFNMGAMENKGLNIFNAKYVLARPETATDVDFQNIDDVIAHEYFHNWSGNRITCRDWFQLSLKEGFTVFREQHFSKENSKSPVALIENAGFLRTEQFAEDNGPLAHPVRPDSYMEINNFYTLTIYEKGAEVIRMMKTLLGEETFRKAMDLYFDTYDGQAVTIEEFVTSMERASKRDLTQFRLWYYQAGTPKVTVSTTYNEKEKTYTLEMEQACLPTPGQTEKNPLHIPIAVGLLDEKGSEIPLQLQGETKSVAGTKVLEMTEQKHLFTFVNVDKKPVPSLLRDFSAPVRLVTDLQETDLEFLLRFDPNAFNRWDAGQQWVLKLLLEKVTQSEAKKPSYEKLITIYRSLLQSNTVELSLMAELLRVPSFNYFCDQLTVPVDVEKVYAIWDEMRDSIIQGLKSELLAVYEKYQIPGTYRYTPENVAKRQLKNQALYYLTLLKEPKILEMCLDQFRSANNMTDRFAALSALVEVECKEREEALAMFYEQFKEDTLVINKWLSVQAKSELPNTLEKVIALTQHPAFDIHIPNKVYAVLVMFAKYNVRFHEKTGKGYRWLADQVLQLDQLNPQVAARTVRGFERWRKFTAPYQDLMRIELERIEAQKTLSKDIREIVTKYLA